MHLCHVYSVLDAGNNRIYVLLRDDDRQLIIIEDSLPLYDIDNMEFTINGEYVFLPDDKEITLMDTLPECDLLEYLNFRRMLNKGS